MVKNTFKKLIGSSIHVLGPCHNKETNLPNSPFAIFLIHRSHGYIKRMRLERFKITFLRQTMIQFLGHERMQKQQKYSLCPVI